MAQDYYTILTNAGLAYEAQQKAQNKPITLVAMAIGDGNGAAYNPDPAATTLRREVHRQAINSLLQDANNPTWLVAEAWLADDVGGWTIREVGIYTDTGVLYAIAKYPESIKPLLVSGSGKQFYVRTIFQTSNVASVVLQVDNSVVMATRAFVVDYVRDELAKLDSKPSVRVATTANIALTGLQTIDGVVLVAGDRILVKDQAEAKDNGIYVAAVGVWSRAADADSAAKLNAGAIVPVAEGAQSADTQWTLRTDGAIVIGTTALTFQWLAGANAPDQPASDDSRKVANTAFVQRAVSEAAKEAGLPRFTPYLWGGRGNAMPEGDTQSSGQQLLDLMYPTMRADVTATQFTCTEAIWQADPYMRVTHWSLGDGASWMRPPDKNGVQPGNVGAFYGVGSNPAGAKTGTAVIDAMRNLTGRIGNIFGGTLDLGESGSLKRVQTGAPVLVNGAAAAHASFDIKFNAADSLPAGTTTDSLTGEFRPRSWYGIWMIRMYGRVVNPGMLDAAGLNARMDMIDVRVATLEGIPKPIGYQQAWTNVLASRALGTNYTNNTGRTITVSVSVRATGTGASLSPFVNDEEISQGVYNYNGSAPTSVYFTVGPGKFYRVAITAGTGTLNLWKEER